MYLREHFISQGKDLSMVVLKQQILMLVQGFVALGEVNRV
jgi:hypothetical protein